MDNIIGLKPRYAPVKIQVDNTYGELMADVMVAMEAFRQSKMTTYLYAAEAAMTALVDRAKSGV